jgi:hypothetical protein
LVKKPKAIVVGAGFYGLMLATFLKKKYDVLILEEQSEPMSQASNLCQMRIHTGMMYPRNITTAISCLKTFKPFMLRFKDAIVDDFISLYAVAKDSKISASDFYNVQKSLGQNIKKAKFDIFDNVQEVFECTEFTFDIEIIKQTLLNEIDNVLYNKKVINLYKNTLVCSDSSIYMFDKVFLCSYAGINDILLNSDLPIFENYKTEISEKIYFRDNLDNVALCVVDGNYFSSMCLPKRFNGLKTLTGADLTNNLTSKTSNYEKVFERVRKYIPEIKLEYKFSDFGKKCYIQTPDNQNRICHVLKTDNVYSILGGKINNVFDLFKELKNV